MWTDIRQAFRLMARAPAFTVAVVLTIALAIAANTAIFTVVNAVMLRPLPFAEPARLVQIAEKNDKLNLASFGASVLNFLSWREQAGNFAEIAAIGFANYTLSAAGEPEQFAGNRISPALMRVLGVAPIVGRSFSDDEEKPAAAPVAMIGEGVWKRRFGGDPSVVGRKVVLNGAPTTIVGVAPAALNLLSGGDVYMPLTIDPSKEIRLNHVIFVVGRLRAGVSMQQAQAEMDAVSRRVGQQYPEVRDWGIRLITMFDTLVSPETTTGILVLFAAVLLVLLIACANIASLLLARSAARQKEMAMRAALGAGRLRLFRQLLVESLALAAIGGAGGVLLAYWCVPAMNRVLPPNVLPIPTITIDASVLWFALLLTGVTGLVFGIAPAWHAASADLSAMLKLDGRGSGSLRARFHNALACAELALATVLLIGAGLMIKSLANLESVHTGFDSRDVITFQLAPPTAAYPVDSRAPAFYRALLASLRAMPGVRDAAVSSAIPFGAGSYTTHPMLAGGQSVLPPGTAVPIDWRIVSPGFFRALRIPLVRGRDFTDADGPAAQRVTIVSEATAKKFWRDADPIGRTLVRSADPRNAFTVVGVVGDVRNTALNRESPTLYYPIAARVSPLMDVVVRTGGAPDALLPSIRQKVHELDPALALANVRTLDEWLSNGAAQPRLDAWLLGAFAAAAMIIAAIGIYGVLAYSVSQRTREIGVRIALGATSREILGLVVREGMAVALTGLMIGVAGGLGLGRTLASLVFGVTVRDPATYIGVAALLAGVSLAACVFPAARAARIDPIVALRYE